MQMLNVVMRSGTYLHLCSMFRSMSETSNTVEIAKHHAAAGYERSCESRLLFAV
jgi:hypothetical protein